MATEIIWHQKQFFTTNAVKYFMGEIEALKKQQNAPNLTVFVQAATAEALGIFAFFSDAIALDAGKHFKLNGKIVAQYALC